MQSLQGNLHLGGMKMIFRWLIPAAVSLAALLSCSKTGPDVQEEFEAEWVAAYYLGPDESGTVQVYDLTLVQGRTDDELMLISPGAVAHLIIGAPAGEEGLLPDGTYTGSDATDPYTLALGHSVVQLRTELGNEVVEYQVSDGLLRLSRKGDDSWSVDVDLDAQAKHFRFGYTGTVETYNLTKLF